MSNTSSSRIKVGDVGKGAAVAAGAGSSASVVNNYYYTTQPDWNPKPYLQAAIAEYNRFRLAVLDARQLKAEERPLTLAEIYTDLETAKVVVVDETGRILTDLVHDVQIGARVKVTSVGTRKVEENKGVTHRLTALEAISLSYAPRVVLLGYPGSGKSTFVNYVALRLAHEQLESGSPEGVARLQASGWALGALWPVRVVLRELVAWSDSKKDEGRELKDEKATAQTLWSFIEHDTTQLGYGDDFKYLKKHLQSNGGLILLDGLDEVREADQRREFIKQTIERFADANPKCRFVVTCRPYAYEKRAWQLANFTSHTLALFSPEQIEKFIRHWYTVFGPREGWSEARAQTKTDTLITATATEHLRELAARPLLLTLMATLHTAGELPKDRADLYGRCVELLLDKWQSDKDGGGLQTLGLPPDTVAQVMARVAFAAHQRQGQASNRQREQVADISHAELRHAFTPLLHSVDAADRVIAYIQTRAGLLTAQDNQTYTFPHRSFQEFLAACDLLRDNEADLAELTRTDRDWWREVFLFAAKRASLKEAVSLMDALCYAEVHAGQALTEIDAYAAFIAAQAAVECALPHNARSTRFQHTLKKLRAWLVVIIEQGVLPLTVRAEVGRVLSMLVDPRPDVSCDIPALVEVPAGEFIIGSDTSDEANEKPQHHVYLPTYYIGKYPVTNEQYRRFVDDGGYTEKWRVCWTEAGWQWRTKGNITQPGYWDDSQWNLANHPVVGVSWFEAVAYCNWLTQTDTQVRVFRLPTEAEWEKAARGGIDLKGVKRGNPSGLVYPWGNKFDQEKANMDESGIGRTSAVGLLPLGASPYGALDMAGNMWDWCQSQYAEYPYRVDGREDVNTGGERAWRVLRGGSWNDLRWYCRAAWRGWDVATLFLSNVGFRVVRSPVGS